MKLPRYCELFESCFIYLSRFWAMGSAGKKSRMVSVEEGRAKMSSINALIFFNFLLLITPHTCGNRLYKIKAETFASNRLENSEDAREKTDYISHQREILPLAAILEVYCLPETD